MKEITQCNALFFVDGIVLTNIRTQICNNTKENEELAICVDAPLLVIHSTYVIYKTISYFAVITANF